MPDAASISMYKPAPIVLALTLAIFPAGRSLADFTDGLEAYSAGDYATACDEWLPLARAGDTGAQVAMAGLFYRSAPGTRQNAVQAAHWYRRAAESGNAEAQLNLAELYDFGRGVERDPARAMFWLGLAAAQGNGWAVARRQSLAAGLPKQARDRADRMLADWRASH